MKAAINLVIDRYLQHTIHSNSPSQPLTRHERHLCWMAPHAGRTASETLHLIARHQVWSGLQFRTWLTDKDVSFTSNWPNGMVRRRALNPPAFTAGQVQQRQLQNKKPKPKSFHLFWEQKLPYRCFSITKQCFTFPRSCESAKWICSFFSKALEFSVLEIINTITQTNMVCHIWLLSFRFSIDACLPAYT